MYICFKMMYVNVSLWIVKTKFGWEAISSEFMTIRKFEHTCICEVDKLVTTYSECEGILHLLTLTHLTFKQPTLYFVILSC